MSPAASKSPRRASFQLSPGIFHVAQASEVGGALDGCIDGNDLLAADFADEIAELEYDVLASTPIRCLACLLSSNGLTDVVRCEKDNCERGFDAVTLKLLDDSGAIAGFLGERSRHSTGDLMHVDSD